MKISSNFIYAFLLLFLWFIQTTQSQDNVLLIIADDYGADSSGLYFPGNTAPTPNINALSANGVRFTNAWSQPSCAPTRATILTGRYGFRTGVGTPGHTIPLNEFTIAQALKTAGYNTACIGKWHLSGNDNGGNDNPNLMGYDHYEGAITGVNNYFNWTKVTNGTTTRNVTTYATTENVNNALSWINAQGTTPWFCQLAFSAPHTPYHLPPNDLHSFNLSGRNNDINNNPLSYYHAMIEAMDTEIGRLLNSMDAVTRANTTVIFIGDNGTPRAVAPGVVRQWKGTLYEGGVHVPFVVSGPTVNSPGRTVDANIHTVDLFESILDIAGISSNEIAPEDVQIDSVSFMDYLTNANQDNYHSFNFADTFRTQGGNNDGTTISDGNYKFIRFNRTGAEALYHIANDPMESTNLNDGTMTNDQQAAFDDLKSKLDTMLNGQDIDREEAREPIQTGFVPDPNKRYYLDVTHHNLRIASDGSSNDPYTTSINTTGADVEWKFVDKGNGYWHIDRAAGGSRPRLRSRNSAYADMQATSSSGTYTYYDISEGASSGTYFLTLPDGPGDFVRLQIDNRRNVKMVSTSHAGTWESILITEVSSGSAAKIVDSTLEKDHVLLYPNPVKDQLQVVLPEYKNYEALSIIDLTGKLIMERSEINSNQIEIDTQQLPKGIYFLKAYNSVNGMNQVYRFVK